MFKLPVSIFPILKIYLVIFILQVMLLKYRSFAIYNLILNHSIIKDLNFYNKIFNYNSDYLILSEVFS